MKTFSKTKKFAALAFALALALCSCGQGSTTGGTTGGAQTSGTVAAVTTAATVQTNATTQSTLQSTTQTNATTQAGSAPEGFKADPIKLLQGWEVISEQFFEGKVTIDGKSETCVMRTACIKDVDNFTLGGQVMYIDALDKDGHILANFYTMGYGFFAVTDATVMYYNINAIHSEADGGMTHGRYELTTREIYFNISTGQTGSKVKEVQSARMQFNVMKDAFLMNADALLNYCRQSVDMMSKWKGKIVTVSTESSFYTVPPADGKEISDNVTRPAESLTMQTLEELFERYYKVTIE